MYYNFRKSFQLITLSILLDLMSSFDTGSSWEDEKNQVSKSFQGERKMVVTCFIGDIMEYNIKH